jgi:hemerythrin
MAQEEMPMLLMWTGNLSVGVKAFDDDHKQLIRIINELHGAIQNVNETGEIEGAEVEMALHRLENYSRGHCSREEALMEKFQYPDNLKHKQQHQEFYDRIADMTERFRGSKSPKHAEEVMQFIYSWLTNHINESDKAVSLYLREKGFFREI